MEELTLQVKGSSSDPYELTFIKDGVSLTALCTCPAGSFGNSCKHRVAILDGDAAAVLDDDKGKIATVVDWLVGTDVESALQAMRDLDAVPDATKEAKLAAKKKLAKAMNS
jgi:uncharacterized Zn finger protein